MRNNIKTRLFKYLAVIAEFTFIVLVAYGLLGLHPVRAATYAVPNELEVSQLEAWIALERKLLKDPDPVITIDIDGYGGLDSMANTFIQIVESLKAHGKKVVFVVLDEAGSNHAMIACTGSEIIFKNQGKLVFHDGYDHDASVLADKKVYIVNDSADFDQCVKAGYLTQSDVFTITVLHKRIEETKNLHKLILDDFQDF